MRFIEVISKSVRQNEGCRSLWSYLTLAVISLVFAGGCSCRSEAQRTRSTTEHSLPQESALESPNTPPKAKPATQAANKNESPNSTSDSVSDNAKDGSGDGQITGSAGARAGDVTTTNKRSTRYAMTPAEARLNGNQLLKAANAAAAAGHMGKAYEKALAAWQGLQPHLNNDECRRLSKEVLEALERYGEAANKKSLSATGEIIRRKPIVVK